MALERKAGICFKLEFVKIFVKGLLKPKSFASGRKPGNEQAGGGGQRWGPWRGGCPVGCASISGKYLTKFPAVQWRKGKINWVEKCPFASEVRGRTITNGAPNAALLQLVCGLTPGLVFGDAGACESKGEREKLASDRSCISISLCMLWQCQRLSGYFETRPVSYN